MFAVIDCGTTKTRVYIVDAKGNITASGIREIGVRDTSITGSRDVLRIGITDLFFQVLRENHIPDRNVNFVISSGMITSEVGLLEIPHLHVPVGIQQLSENVVEIKDPEVLPVGRPVYFIRGVCNAPEGTRLGGLLQTDFMRGEEVQCVGIMQGRDIPYPANIVALSSHTKIMCIDQARQITASMTTISGQLRAAWLQCTSIAASVKPETDEEPGRYSFEEIADAAMECVRAGGLGRALLGPRLLQVFYPTNSAERMRFLDAAIAADDMAIFREMRRQERGDYYLLYGYEERCRLYTYFIKKEFGADITVESIYEKDQLAQLTVDGVIAIAQAYL